MPRELFGTLSMPSRDPRRGLLESKLEEYREKWSLVVNSTQNQALPIEQLKGQTDEWYQWYILTSLYVLGKITIPQLEHDMKSQSDRFFDSERFDLSVSKIYSLVVRGRR